MSPNTSLQQRSSVANDLTGRNAADDCTRVRALGYHAPHHIKMYGERFEIVSDPFPDEGGVSVEAITATDPVKRKLRLPIAILLGLGSRFLETA